MTPANARTVSNQIQIDAPSSNEYSDVLTADALAFLGRLAGEFRQRRDELLQARQHRQQQIREGARPDFLPQTRSIREGDWTVAPIPADLRERRVEITGPVDRKMVINALNSGTNLYMADFEDSNAPTWDNTIQGQINLRDAVNKSITHTSAEGKQYRLNDTVATLKVRPRGLHLDEKHMSLDGEPVPASLVDFGLFFYHNARTLLDRGSGPYYYIPKLESHLEARWWNDVFQMAQDDLNVPRGSIRATVLIETITAAFEMDEILHELKDHSAGLNCGRWDYIFSMIKKFHHDPRWVLPDRAQVTMTTHCMRSYSLLAIKTCHRRGIHAIGGMAAQIPIKNDPQANELAMEKVREDKQREASDGHDGTWVAHPGLVAIAREAFDAHMSEANQIDRQRDDVNVTAADLLTVPDGQITREGVCQNIDVGIQYMAAWLSGNGCVPIYNLMEDAATAEISRSQLWQWLHHPTATLKDGSPIDETLCRKLFDEQMVKLKERVGPQRFAQGKFEPSRQIIEDIVSRDTFTDFMTVEGYAHLP